MTIAYVYGQDNLTVNQFEKDKYICFKYENSNERSFTTPMKFKFVIGKDPNTNENITMDVLGDYITSADSKFNRVPIPNQLLNGDYCGEVYFRFYLWEPSKWNSVAFIDSPNTIDYGQYYILTINKADRPSDYECVPTPLLNDYNAEVVIDTSKASCLQIKSIDTNKLYTGTGGGNRTYYDNVFGTCGNITSLDLSNFNTSAVTHMSFMFRYCISLTSLDLSSFDTSKVTDMSGMFYNCKSLTSLNLSSFNTSKVYYMNSMFYGCTSLTSLDLSSFNTSNASYIGGMFYNCKSLTSLDLSSFNTSKVTDMSNLFSNCESLTSLNLSSFNTSNVTSMEGMFKYCSALTHLTIGSDWGINTSITLFNLSDCTSLSHDSCLDVFNKLADKTQTATTSATLQLSSTTKALMSSTEIAIATNKGWTVS